MKLTIIFSAFLILGLAGISNAQTSGTFRLTFSGQAAANGSQTTTVSFTGLENPNIRLLEAVVPATSEAECFAITDISNARVLGPDRATIVYDASTLTYKLIWMTPKENRGSCRILMGDGDVDGRDFLLWQKTEPPSPGLDGSVRHVSHSIALNAWY
jgi:hypothetical protein